MCVLMVFNLCYSDYNEKKSFFNYLCLVDIFSCYSTVLVEFLVKLNFFLAIYTLSLLVWIFMLVAMLTKHCHVWFVSSLNSLPFWSNNPLKWICTKKTTLVSRRTNEKYFSWHNDVIVLFQTGARFENVVFNGILD